MKIMAFLVFLTSCQASLGILLTYQEHCGTYGAYCDLKKFLVCVNSRCTCQKQDDMVFDPDLDTCVTKLHKQCEIRRVWDHPFHPKTVDADYYSKTTSCVQTAVCDRETKLCRCPEDANSYKNNWLELNYPSKTEERLVSTCDENNKCPRDTGLHCINGFCQCDGTGLKYYNGVKCISRVDGFCRSTEDCTKFAECMEDNSGLPKHCRCSKGYVSSYDGKCYGDYGTSCNSKEPCISMNEPRDLKCVDGTCGCASDLEYYDEKEKACHGLVGSVCKDSVLKPCKAGANKFCVENAICYNQWLEYFTCECKPGFFVTANRTCVKKA